MVITAIKTRSTKGSLDNVGPTIVSVFECRFTGAFDPVYLFQNAHAVGLPDYGDYVAGTTSEMYCSHVEYEINPGSVWTGTTTHPGSLLYSATFSTITAERLDLSPLSRPQVVTGGGIELTEVRRVDINQQPIVNSAGDYYEGLPSFYIPGSEICVSYNTAANPLSLCQTYSFTTNSSSIWGQAAYSGCTGRITAQEMYETYQGLLIKYWRVSVPMRFRNDGNSWNFLPFDYGYRYKDGGKIKNYVDEDSGVYGPVFLDGQGGLLNGDGTANGGNAVVYPTGSGGGPDGYQTLTSTSWGGLGVQNPFTA